MCRNAGADEHDFATGQHRAQALPPARQPPREERLEPPPHGRRTRRPTAAPPATRSDSDLGPKAVAGRVMPLTLATTSRSAPRACRARTAPRPRRAAARSGRDRAASRARPRSVMPNAGQHCGCISTTSDSRDARADRLARAAQRVNLRALHVHADHRRHDLAARGRPRRSSRRRLRCVTAGASVSTAATRLFTYGIALASYWWSVARAARSETAASTSVRGRGQAPLNARCCRASAALDGVGSNAIDASAGTAPSRSEHGVDANERADVEHDVARANRVRAETRRAPAPARAARGGAPAGRCGRLRRAPSRAARCSSRAHAGSGRRHERRVHARADCGTVVTRTADSECRRGSRRASTPR